jgi:phosphoribosylformylglycinamidine cyclo-ligase
MDPNHSGLRSRYDALGVSSGKAEVHAAIAMVDKGLSSSLFCKVLPDIFCQDPAYCVCTHADGAGTKSSLAYAYWRETGDLSVFRGIAQDSLVMNIDDLLCIGANCAMIASSAIDRNKFLVPAPILKELIEGTESFLEMLRKHGLEIYSGGGETADVSDLTRTLIVNSTVTTRMRREQLVDTKNICAGDVIVGLASFGKARYETEYNSGIGSNGLTLARHTLFSRAVGEEFPETFDATLGERAYAGPHRLTDSLKTTELTMGRAVLSPTRTYAPIIIDVLNALEKDVHGLIHCSGGGQTKVLKFLHGVAAVKNNLFPTPPLFGAIQSVGAIAWREMFEVFNMGHRMEVYCPKERAQDVIQLSERFNVQAQIIGEVIKANQPSVQISTEHGCFTYHSS